MSIYQKPFRGILLSESHFLAKGFVGLWIFNEGSGGKIFDLSLNGNNGILTNMAPGEDWVSGRDGYALDFDGDNDHVSLGTGRFLFNSNESFTFIARIKSNSTEAGNWFFSTSDGGVGDSWWGVRTNSRRFEGFIDDNTNTSLLISTTDVADNTWRFVSYVVNRSTQTAELGVDGKLESVDTDISNVGNFTTSNITKIGERSAAGNFNGLIGEVYIYNRALLIKEIELLYNNPYIIFDKSSMGKLFFEKQRVAKFSGSGKITFSGISGAITIN